MWWYSGSPQACRQMSKQTNQWYQSKFGLPTCYRPVSKMFQCASYVHRLKEIRNKGHRLVQCELRQVDGQDRRVLPCFLSFFFPRSIPRSVPYIWKTFPSFLETAYAIVLSRVDCDEIAVGESYWGHPRSILGGRRMDRLDGSKVPLPSRIGASASSKTSSYCVYFSSGDPEWDWANYNIDKLLNLVYGPIAHPRNLTSRSSPSYSALTPFVFRWTLVVITTMRIFSSSSIVVFFSTSRWVPFPL